MTVERLNPNHPATQVMDYATQLLTFLVHKMGGHAVISLEDIKRIADGPMLALKVQELDDGLHLTIVSEGEAQRLAKIEGGRPN